MTDGTVGWNPGKLNPKILKPAGPIDPEVAVVLLRVGDDGSQAAGRPTSTTRSTSTTSAG